MSYLSTYYKGCGLAQGWFLDINTNAAANNTESYTRQGYLISNPNPKGSLLHSNHFIQFTYLISKQSERLTEVVVGLTVRMEFSANALSCYQ